jgi:cytochrome c oxidase subunit 2
MRNRKDLLAATGLVIVVTLILYFVLRAIYQLPVAASDEADRIDVMFRVYFGLIAFMFSLIMVFMVYAVFAFRRQPGDTQDAAHIHGNTTLEILWTILPLALVIGLGVWGTTTLNALNREEANEMVVRVTGQQWSWSFGYPAYGDITSAELVLAVDQPVVLEMTSRDVLHSFWVPEFRVKQDLLPGRETILRITPTEVGNYTLRCAEICGLNHTDMLADVRVLARSDFESWVEEQRAIPAFAELSPEERGEIWYSGGQGDFVPCSGCHSVDGSPLAAPTWLGLVGREELLDDGSTVIADEAYINKSIVSPAAQIVDGFQNVMPQTYESDFVQKQAEILASEGIEIDIIDDIIAYLKTLEE